ncbi:hypothetical protein ACOMHN_012318 [Nucella lapillus]
MPQCAALGCNNRSGRSKGKTFHRFPTDVERRPLWIRALKREGFQPGKNARLCGDHFEERCFIHTGKLRLREDAVPSVFSFSAYPEKDQTYKGPRQILKKQTKMRQHTCLRQKQTTNGQKLITQKKTKTQTDFIQKRLKKR